MGKNYLCFLVKEPEFCFVLFCLFVCFFFFAVVASYNIFNKKNVFMCSEKTVW